MDWDVYDWINERNSWSYDLMKERRHLGVVFHPPAGLWALRPPRTRAGIAKALVVIMHLESDWPLQAPGDVEQTLHDQLALFLQEIIIIIINSFVRRRKSCWPMSQLSFKCTCWRGSCKPQKFNWRQWSYGKTPWEEYNTAHVLDVLFFSVILNNDVLTIQ